VVPECSDEEKCLVSFANSYFRKSLAKTDAVCTYSGVRPLYDGGARSVSAATLNYVLKTNVIEGAPMLNILGSKITTYNCLAEDALEKIAGVALPGGEFGVSEVSDRITTLHSAYPFLSQRWTIRLIKAYGKDTFKTLSDATSKDDLGHDFGATLSEKQV
jgi:glycerol-3-phosphate dehydrogenase